jgi:signal transduction histidine kinase
LDKNPIILNADPDVDKIQRDISNTTGQGRVWRGEILNKKKNGELFPLHASVYQLLDEEGNFIAVVGFQEDITKRKQTEEELRTSREQLRNLAAHLQSARETERTSIARQIHDELGPSLTGLKMDLFWLVEKIPKEEPLLEKIQTMINLIDTNINTVRRISADLRPGMLDVLGLMPALEWQAEEFQNRTGVKCTITPDPEEILLDKKLSTDLFRIFQEVLTNVARHAQATRVTASFKKKENYLLFKIRDNGTGITAEQISDPRSFGLIGIRERIHHWRGTVTIKGVANKGTTVTVRVPS